jgi:GT2 family glycosyltransferase
MAKFSIVSVISRPEIFESCLLASINQTRGDHDIEIIPIFNDNNQYSASAALNVGLDVATADVIVFAHQDVRLLHDWFDRLVEALAELPEQWGVLGAAGISLAYGRSNIGKWGGALDVNTVAVGSVWDNDEALTQVPYWDGLKDVTPVHCVDECVFVVNRRTGLRFDLQFTGFHFYGVDVCLQARAASYRTFAAHLPIIHYGKYSASFSGDRKYWVYLRLLHNKWRMRFPEVLGTHFHWSHETTYDFYGSMQLVPELTSYIDVMLDSDDGIEVHLKAMGLHKVRLKSDKRQGLLDL